tara:strand:- start:797 stop:1246 length:450 start_codon:yes stop_codon:yes gene_type:complete
MVQLPNTIITADHEDTRSDSFEPIPKGEYTAMVNYSEMKDTKSGNGQYLELTFEVLEGDHKGRLVWERLNLVNPNATAVEIAQRKLAEIGRSVGLQTVEDSVQLHDKPMKIKVLVEPATADYSASNKINGFSSASNLKASPAEEVKLPF